MKHYAIVGMRHRGAVELVASLPETEPLELVREPDNKYDRFAIQVWARGLHVGYVAASQNRDLATFMDARQKKFPLGGEQARLQAKLHISSGNRAPLAQVMEMA